MPTKNAGNSNINRTNNRSARICFWICVIFVKLIVVVAVVSVRRRASSYSGGSSYETQTMPYTPMMPLVTPAPSDVDRFNLIYHGSTNDEEKALRNQILSNLLDFSDGKTEVLEAKKGRPLQFKAKHVKFSSGYFSLADNGTAVKYSSLDNDFWTSMGLCCGSQIADLNFGKGYLSVKMFYTCDKNCSSNKGILTELNFTRGNHSSVDHMLMPPTAAVTHGSCSYLTGDCSNDYDNSIHLFEHKIEVDRESASIRFIPDFDGTVTNFAVNFTATTYYDYHDIISTDEDQTINKKLMFSLDIN